MGCTWNTAPDAAVCATCRVQRHTVAVLNKTQLHTRTQLESVAAVRPVASHWDVSYVLLQMLHMPCTCSHVGWLCSEAIACIPSLQCCEGK